ncbi:MAG: SDR family NAD(P)-dependent oxidoreductase [Planctomycetota bacterium]|jgi:short-subunit dehydrogenase
MPPEDPETVLITGASAGIGRALAQRFALDGARLVLVARREERLRELAVELIGQGAPQPVVLPWDLGAAGSGERLAEHLKERGLRVDVLVNNAGFGLHEAFVEHPPERLGSMLALNVEALTLLTHRLLPAMLERGRGGVLNVASTAAFQPGPGMSAYFATKAYVLALSEGLHEELRGSGVTCTALCPGATSTEFLEVAGLPATRAFRLVAQSPEAVARSGHRAFRCGRAVAVSGWLNALGTLGVRLGPRALVRRIVARVIG